MRATCLALLAALLLAAPAAAAERYVVPAGHLTRFELSGSNGYRVSVSVNEKDFVTLRASKGPVTTEYLAADRSDTRDGASARFPGRGTVSFGFTPSGRERLAAPIPGCGGVRETVREGVARGLIRFRAERGYTAIRTRRVRAETRSWPRHECRRPGFSASGANTPFFYAFSPGPAEAEFGAARYPKDARPPSRRIEFGAGASSVNAALAIYRWVSVTTGLHAFQQPEPETAPEHLLLTPPPPFSGSAEFKRLPESTFAWTGSLRVRFPGIDPVKLTGADFATSFCAQRGCAEQVPEGLFGLPY